jgi:hypothetical protein
MILLRDSLIDAIKDEVAPDVPLVYLGAPYSHPWQAWGESRIAQVDLAAMVLIKRGLIVFSPLSHSYPIANKYPECMFDHDLWLGQDLEFLKWANVLLCLRLPGYTESKGLSWELQWFHSNKPEGRVFYTDMNEIYDLGKEIWK